MIVRVWGVGVCLSTVCAIVCVCVCVCVCVHVSPFIYISPSFPPSRCVNNVPQDATVFDSKTSNIFDTRLMQCALASQVHFGSVGLK